MKEFLDPRSYITANGRGRVRLKGEDYRLLAVAAYIRSGSKCECGCGKPASAMVSPPHPNAGELSHNEHGARKSDELHRVRWLNWQCHAKLHNAGGKPCPCK